MRIANTKSLFKHIHSSTFDDNAAAMFSKKAGARVGPGDELRSYVDADGAAAQAILARDKAECAVAYNPRDGFMWGLLVEVEGRAMLIGDGDPHVVIDLQDLSFTVQRVS